MRVAVLHRIPFGEVHYDKVIDHDVHDVIYVGPKAALADIPSGLRCQKLERPGIAPTWEEVVAVLAGKPRPDRVVSLSELELLDAARVREQFEVPGKSLEEVLLVRDKVKMKDAIHAAGLPAPRFVPCDALLAEGAVVPPWTGKTVLKPRDGACSRDTVTFAKAAEAVMAVRAGTTGIAAFQAGQFELEEFVKGPVFHVDGVIQDGRLRAAMANRYINTPLEYAHGAPMASVEINGRPDLERLGEACSRAVGHHTGVFHMEGIFSDDGPVFLEIAARAGAASVAEVFELAHGVNLYEVMLSFEVYGHADMARADHHRRVSPTYGWFVFPGHRLGRGGMRVEGAERIQRDRRVLRWVQLPDGHPAPQQISYAEDSPITGMLQGGSTAELETFVEEMFRTVRVQSFERSA